jgi:hypothetical protein
LRLVGALTQGWSFKFWLLLFDLIANRVVFIHAVSAYEPVAWSYVL